MDKDIAELPLFVRAELALKAAVGKVIEEHRRTGEPLVLWRNGRVELVPPDEVEKPEVTSELALLLEEPS